MIKATDRLRWRNPRRFHPHAASPELIVILAQPTITSGAYRFRPTRGLSASALLRQPRLSRSGPHARRLVAFQDESVGQLTSWKWDFGDGETSTEQHPLHTYKKSDKFIVVLHVTGPDGTSRRAKIWDVALR